MQLSHTSERTRLAEVWAVLGTILVANALFVAGISAGILPQRLFAYGRFVLLGLVLTLLVGCFRGLGGLAGLLRPMTVWRVAPGWYLLALVWAPLVCVVVLLGKQLATGAEVLRVDLSVFSSPSAVLAILVASFVGEIVWVSYAINRLSGRFTVLEASLIVGVFWTLWWMPIVLLGIGVIPVPFGALFVNMLGVAAMCGFVYARTGSGLVVLVMQVTLNSMLLVFPVIPSSGGNKTYWLFALVYLLAAVALHLGFGPRPLLSLRRGVIQGGVLGTGEPAE